MSRPEGVEEVFWTDMPKGVGNFFFPDRKRPVFSTQLALQSKEKVFCSSSR